MLRLLEKTSEKPSYVIQIILLLMIALAGMNMGWKMALTLYQFIWRK